MSPINTQEILMFEYDFIIEIIHKGLVFPHLDENKKIKVRPILNSEQEKLLEKLQKSDLNYIFLKSFEEEYYINMVKVAHFRGAVGANVETVEEYNEKSLIANNI